MTSTNDKKKVVILPFYYQDDTIKVLLGRLSTTTTHTIPVVFNTYMTDDPSQYIYDVMKLTNDHLGIFRPQVSRIIETSIFHSMGHVFLVQVNTDNVEDFDGVLAYNKFHSFRFYTLDFYDMLVDHWLPVAGNFTNIDVSTLTQSKYYRNKEQLHILCDHITTYLQEQ